MKMLISLGVEKGGDVKASLGIGGAIGTCAFLMMCALPRDERRQIRIHTLLHLRNRQNQVDPQNVEAALPQNRV